MKKAIKPIAKPKVKFTLKKLATDTPIPDPMIMAGIKSPPMKPKLTNNKVNIIFKNRGCNRKNARIDRRLAIIF